MKLFAHLKTRVKLLLCFGLMMVLTILVSAAAVQSNVESISAASNIDSILTRSYNRVNQTRTALLNANMLAIESLNPWSSNVSIQDFSAQMDALLKQIGDAAAVMNDQKIGDLDSSPQYQKQVLQVKQDARHFIELYQKHVVPQLNARNKTMALNQFLTLVFPAALQSLNSYQELIDEQIAVTKQLSVQGADPTMLYIGLAITAAAILIGIAVTMLLSSYIGRSLKVQMDLMERMAEGDFSENISAEGSDEFAQSRQLLMRMKDSLSRSIAAVISKADSLQAELLSLQQQTDVIVEQTGQTENQSITVAAASNEMVSTTQEIAKNCEGAAASSEHSKNITSSGMDKVRTAVQQIQEQTAQTKVNAGKIEALAEQCHEIGSIVSTISGIAAQTNLLALNAAIEAARAGDAGRGFAVVADEVRALAMRSAKSTQEISTIVEKIQGEAAAATSSINESVGSMDQVAEDACQIEGILQEIIQQVLNVNGQITQIATAAEEQTTATSEISTNMQSVTTAAQNIASMAQQAHGRLGDVHHELGELKQELGHFKLAAAA